MESIVMPTRKIILPYFDIPFGLGAISRKHSSSAGEEPLAYAGDETARWAFAKDILDVENLFGGDCRDVLSDRLILNCASFLQETKTNF
jgi:hypothetical protein